MIISSDIGLVAPRFLAFSGGGPGVAGRQQTTPHVEAQAAFRNHGPRGLVRYHYECNGRPFFNRPSSGLAQFVNELMATLYRCGIVPVAPNNIVIQTVIGKAILGPRVRGNDEGFGFPGAKLTTSSILFCDFYRTTSSIIIGLFSVYPLIALYKAFGNIIGLG